MVGVGDSRERASARRVAPPCVPGVHTIAANTVRVSGRKMRELRLLVVPPGTSGGVARAVLRSAASRDTVATAEEILASNGVRTATQSKQDG